MSNIIYVFKWGNKIWEESARPVLSVGDVVRVENMLNLKVTDVSSVVDGKQTITLEYPL